jgi:molecular chaperone IbpA
MATLEVSPLFRSNSVGFERPWNSWHTAMNFDSSGEPAYNILKRDEDEFRISLAVPGLTKDEITIETREGALLIKAARQNDPYHNQYLYKGIGLDGFQRSFQLPEHVRVEDARLEMGMLHIDLVRELPEAMRPQRIEISYDSGSQPVLKDTSEAA